MPCEISTVSLIQSEQRAPAEDVPSIGAPQLQHRILHRSLASSPDVCRGASTDVADCCGTKGLCGNATGASMSMDMETVSYRGMHYEWKGKDCILPRRRMKRGRMSCRVSSKVRHLLRYPASSAVGEMQQYFANYAWILLTPSARMLMPFCSLPQWNY